MENAIEELESQLDDKTPESLFKWMRANIKYKHNKKFNEPEYVLKTKSGDCHDQSYLLEITLRKWGYKANRLFMVEYYDWDKDYGGSTHSICYYMDHGKFKWIETAWASQAGIHEFNSLDELKMDIKNRWEWEGKNDKLYFTPVSLKPPMKFEDFAMKCEPENEPSAKYVLTR